MDDFDLAQLRHAYFHLKYGKVDKQAEFADGLIAPIIRKYEKEKQRG